MTFQIPTYNNQLTSLIEGTDQSGFGGGSVGSRKTMSNATTAYFDTKANTNSNSAGFRGGVFDGRYIYFVPYGGGNTATQGGLVTRFDTTMPFNASASYAAFDLASNVNSMNVGFTGGMFDGRYVYFIPNYFGQLVRYDTTTPLTLSSSYSSFDLAANFNSNCHGFLSAIFDGRYLYLAPNSDPNSFTPLGQIVRYDTTAPFNSTVSYSLFDASLLINSNCVGYAGGTYDGKYVYFSPQFNSVGGASGLVLRYDTTLSFGASSSFATFDLISNVNSISGNFVSALFDGKYVYFSPGASGAGFNGQITRFDTTVSFTSPSSYSFFDTTTQISSLSQGFTGMNFDGRYIYLNPYINAAGISGQITRLDTSRSFFSSSSYSTFDTSAQNTVSAGFIGSIFDGRYLYFVPYQNSDGYHGQITRIDAYPGPQVTSIAATQAPNGFIVGSYVGKVAIPQEGLIVSGKTGFGTTTLPSSQVTISPAVSTTNISTGITISPTYSPDSGTLYGAQIAPAFNPTSNALYPNVYGLNLAPSVTSTGTATVGAAYGQSLGLNIAAGSTTVSTAFSLYAAGPQIVSGTLTTAYSLYVSAPLGSIVNSYTAYLGGKTGINTPTPLSMLDVGGSLSVGSYAGSVAAPSNGLLVSGAFGLKTSTPQNAFDVNGSVAIGSYAGSSAAPGNGLLISGSVGIGTSNPLSTIDVNGGISIGTYAGNVAAAFGSFIGSGPSGFGTSALGNAFFSISPNMGASSGAARGAFISGGTLAAASNGDHLTTFEVSGNVFAKGTSTGLSVSLLDIFCFDAATTGSGTVDNAYGLIIRDSWNISATNKYSFYNASHDPSFFTGPVIFGSAASSNVNIGFGGTFSTTDGASSVGLNVFTTFNPTTTTALYGVVLNPNFTPSLGAVYTTVYGLDVAPTIGGMGTVTNAVGLRVPAPTGAQNNYTAIFDSLVGINTSAPINSLDIQGGVAIGSYAGGITAPNNGLLVSGHVGIGGTTTIFSHLTVTPAATSVNGTARGLLVAFGSLTAAADADQLRVFETSGVLFAKQAFNNLTASLVNITCSSATAAGSGTISNAIGLYIRDSWSLSATNKYSLVNASSDPSTFAGQVFFGSSVLNQVQVDVGGTFTGTDGANTIAFGVNTTLSSTCSTAFAQSITSTFSPPSGATYSNAYGLFIQPTASGAGVVTNQYGLFVMSPTGAANNYSAYFQGRVGISTLTPQNRLDVLGAVAIGSYAGSITAPSRGLIVSGITGFGTSSPSSTAQVSISPSIAGASVVSALSLAPIFTPSSGTLSGASITSAFNPSSGNTFSSTSGLHIAPTVAASGTGTVTTAYGADLSLVLSTGSSPIGTAYSLNIAGPSIFSGTLTTAYSLYVTAPSSAGTIVNSYTAYLGGATGINTSVPKSMLDISGGVSIGTYAGVTAAPANGLIVSGVAGFGTSSPPSFSQVSISPSIGGSSITTALTLSPSFTSSSGAYYGIQATPNFNPVSGSVFTAVYGLNLAPTITTSGTGSVNSAYGESISLAITSTGQTISSAYSLSISGPSIAAGTLATAYSLNIGAPSGGGTIQTAYSLYVAAPTSASANYTAYFGGKTSIGTLSPMSQFDVSGNMSLGAYAGVAAAPANGLIVSGSVGLGTTAPGNSYFAVVPTATASSGIARGAFVSGGTLTASANSDSLKMVDITAALFAKGTNTGLKVTMLDVSCNGSTATGSGTIDTAYALRIRDTWALTATTKYSLFNGSTDPSFFTGSVNFGATANNAYMVFGGTASNTDGSTGSGLLVNQTISPTSTTDVYGENIAPSFNPPVSNSYARATTLRIGGTIGGAGSIISSYSLRVAQTTGATNNYTAWFDSGIGVGTATPRNALDINGSLAIGTYAGATAAPASSLIASGSLAVGTSTPVNKLDVKGGAAFGTYAGSSTAPDNGLIVSGKVGIGTAAPLNFLDVSSMALGTYAGVITAPTSGLVVSGPVGIGISTPLNPLDVSSLALGAYAGNNTAPANGLIVSGQVGIGTNSPGISQVNISPSLNGSIVTGLNIAPSYSQNSGSLFSAINNSPTFAFSAGGTGTIDNAMAESILPTFAPTSSSGTLSIADAFGLYIQPTASPGANGAVSNLYGIYVDTPLGTATNKISGYFASAPVFGTPLDIPSGGTNATTFTLSGSIYYDGSKLASTSSGSAGQVLTSNGFGMAPSFQSAGLSFSTLNLTGFLSSTPPNSVFSLETIVNPASTSALYGFQNLVNFQPDTGATYDNVYGNYIAPTLTANDTGTVVNFYGSYIQSTLFTAALPISNNYGLFVDSASISGEVGISYSLFVKDSPDADTNYTAIFGTTNAAKVGIGTTTPAYTLEAYGAASVNRIYAGGLTSNHQIASLFEGTNQGGLGGGCVGTNKTMSQAATSYFDTTANINSQSAGFRGAVFDGRYIYFVPNSGSTASQAGQITRYDTTLPINASSSYSIFDLQGNISFSLAGFYGGVFDGQYIYFVPNAFSQAVRYNTNKSFTALDSYDAFDLSAIDPRCLGFIGAVFDGRYIYFVPNSNPNTSTSSGLITRYDTTLSFTDTSGYTTFDGTLLNSSCVGYAGGTFDGRYVYFAPQYNGTGSGQITRYDTTLSFGASLSYAIYDTKANVNSLSQNFASAVYDGKYVYFVPGVSAAGRSSQITRFDTSGAFTSPSSYAIFDTSAISSLSQGFIGASFAGRYLYLTPYQNGSGQSGQITRYDTTQSFLSSSSYTIIDTAAGNPASAGFIGSIADGKYLYLVPSQNGSGPFGQITRLDGYKGPLAAALASNQAPQGFVIGAYAGNYSAPAEGLLVSGIAAFGTSSPTTSSQVLIAPTMTTTSQAKTLNIVPTYTQASSGTPLYVALHVQPRFFFSGIATTTINNVYTQRITPTFSPSSTSGTLTLTNAYGLYISPTVTANTGGTVSNLYSLYVAAPSGAANNIGAYFASPPVFASLTPHGVLLGEGTSIIAATAVGTNGQVLIGSTSADPAFATITSSAGTIVSTPGASSLNLDVTGGGLSWTNVTGTSQTIQINRGYIANNAGLVTFTLPTTCPIGQIFAVVGQGAGGWAIAQNASQIIHQNAATTTTGTGGSVSSTARWNTAFLLCTVADTEFVIYQSQGVLSFI
ncbi:MAG: hypothetical protein JSS32_10865 [Verrucomicrobia bacterium]|nr:hypothetical protein [Verrucomicrobiota bacterium]